MGLHFRGVFTPPGYIHIHNNQFKVLPFHVTPQITCPVIRFGYPSECVSHHPNALAVRILRVSIWGGVTFRISFTASAAASDRYRVIKRIWATCQSTRESQQLSIFTFRYLHIDYNHNKDSSLFPSWINLRRSLAIM